MNIAFRYMPKQKFKSVHPHAKRIRASWSKAFEELRYELGRIQATDVVLESGYRADQLRNDGLPYSNARPEHGQARVSFVAGKRPLSFFFGGWVELEQNLYMIALTLKALRAVDRYGCTQSGQQYTGWSQLPPGTGQPITAAEWPSVEAAARWLIDFGGHRVVFHPGPDMDAGVLQDIYRAAARKAHPDTGGTAELMAKVNRAKAFIESGGGA